MKEEFKEWLAMIWQEDRGQCLGLASGIILALILLIGFWRTAFIVLCGVVSRLCINRKADREEDFFGRIADDLLDRINRLRSWRAAKTAITIHDFRKVRKVRKG